MSVSNKGAGVDTRLQSVTNALFLNQVDDVVMRTHVDGITLQGNVIVDAVRLWDGVDVLEFEPPNNDNEPGQVALPAETYNMVFNQSTGLWDRLRGSAASGAWVTVKNDRIAISKDADANSDTNRIFVNTTGTVSLSQTSLDALENINATVSGTVSLSQTSLDALENINATVSGTVSLSQTSLDALETITVNQGTAGASAWKVDIGNNGLVGLNAGSNTIGNVKIVDANGNQNDNTHPLYVNVANDIEIKNDSGNPIPISANTSVNSSSNPIYTSVASGGMTAFGEPLAIEPHPIVQLDPIFGVDSPTLYQTYTSGGGTVTTGDATYLVSCSTTAYSYGVMRSRRFLRYHPGQGAVGRFACMFDTPKANTTQQGGLFNQENGFMIGYNGTKFGILHRRGYKAAIYKITLNSFTGSQTVTVTLGGLTKNISILNSDTIYTAANKIGEAITHDSLPWLAEDKDNTVELLHNGTGAVSGTFSITSSGNLSATITQLRAGAVGTETWYYVSPGVGENGINGTCSIDPTLFNVYQIDYRWLGAGRIQFLYEDPITSNFTVLHTIHWVNAHTIPHIDNPSMKIGFVAYNTGGTNSVTLTGCSLYMANQGILGKNEYTRSTTTTKTSLSKDTLYHIISIHNPVVWKNKINTREVIMQDLTVSCQSTDPLEMHFFIDAALGTGGHDFRSQIDQPVTVSMVDGTIVLANNAPLVSYTIGINGNQQFDLSNYRIVVPPGATVSIAVSSTNSISKVSAGMVWYVD